MDIRALGSAVKETFTRFMNDDPFTLAAALSFYALLSLAPLVLVVLAIVGLVWGERAARGELVGQMETVAGEEGAQAVQTVIANAAAPGHSTVAIIIGLAALLIGATTVFAQLQATLNRIWNVQARPDRNAIWGFIRTRLLSLGTVVLIGVLLLLTMAIGAVLSGIHDYLDQWIPGFAWVWRVFHLLVTVAIITLLVAMIYKYLPDVRIGWRDVWVGAAVTAVLLVIGQFGISIYIGQAGVGTPYGAAGSLVVLVVWVYYSALILLLGAEITQVYALRLGQKIEPAPHAISLEASDTTRKAA